MKTLIALILAASIAACTPVEYLENNTLLCDPNTGKAYIHSATQRYGTTRMASADAVCKQYKAKE